MLKESSETTLGMSVAGGAGTPHGDLPVFITKLLPGAPSARTGQLQVRFELPLPSSLLSTPTDFYPLPPCQSMLCGVCTKSVKMEGKRCSDIDEGGEGMPDKMHLGEGRPSFRQAAFCSCYQNLYTF